MDNVTIILPVYNAQKTLFECIESIRQQTFKDWKLIIDFVRRKIKSLDKCLDVLYHYKVTFFDKLYFLN